MKACFEIDKQLPGYSRIDPDVSFPDEASCNCDPPAAADEPADANGDNPLP